METNSQLLNLPGEASQHLAQHLFNECGTIACMGQGNLLAVYSVESLGKIIQEYWDSLL
jgi:hypothetical protein